MLKTRVLLLALAVFFISSTTSFSEPRPLKMGQMGEMGMGECPMEKMMSKMGSKMGMRGHEPYSKRLFSKLDLSDEQKTKAEKLLIEYKKKTVKIESDVKVAELELKELFMEDKVDLKRVKEKLKDIEALKTELRFFRFTMREELKKILTPEQAKRFKEMSPFGRPAGPSGEESGGDDDDEHEHEE